MDYKDNNSNDRFQSMDMEHTVSAFALVFAASSISLVLLFIEVININIIDPGNMEKHSKNDLISWRSRLHNFMKIWLLQEGGYHGLCWEEARAAGGDEPAQVLTSSHILQI